jgi:hypothetical protein
MGIKTGNCSDAQLLDRYINSSYDKVANVSDNMPSVVTVSNNIDDVNTTADAANSGLLDNLQEFNNIYYGGFVSEAALELLYSGNRPDGNPRQNGDLYYNTTADAMFVWSVSTWTTLTSYSTTREIQTITSPTNTIYFSDIAYTVGAENLTVYLNGVLQVHSPADAPNTRDYEEINGSTIQFNELLEIGDEITAFSGNILGNVEINVNTIIDSYTGADVVANVLTLDTSYATGQNNIYVYVDGIFQASGINYTESSTTTITFDTALDASDTITVITGIIANNNTTSISSRTQIFNIVNDTTNSVTVDAGNEYIPGSNHIQMFINGVKQIYGEAYIENADRRTLTLTDGVYFESGDIVEVVVGVVITNYPQPITFTKQEVQTATAGQTTFTLTNSFSSGANNLSVYVNGVKMLPTDYTEDSNSQITFSSGLNLGDKVQFIVGEVFDGTQSAAATSYTPAGTGAVATTVQAKLRESVSVKDFGAVGDGVTDDAAAFVLADTSSKVVNVPAGTYLIGSNTTLTGHYSFDAGAKLKMASGVVLTVQGNIDANHYQQIFEWVSTSDWLGLSWEVYAGLPVTWLGADWTADYTTSETTYIAEQRAVYAVAPSKNSTSYGLLLYPAGEYNRRKTVICSSAGISDPTGVASTQRRISIKGLGGYNGTQIRTDDNAETGFSAFLFDDGDESQVSNISVVSDAPTASDRVRVDGIVFQGGATEGIVTNCRFQSIGRGVVYETSKNNWVSDTLFDGCYRAGIWLEGNADVKLSGNVEFFDCGVSGDNTFSITESSVTGTVATITAANHGLKTREPLHISGTGDAALDGYFFQARNVTTNTFELYNVDGTAFDAAAAGVATASGLTGTGTKQRVAGIVLAASPSNVLPRQLMVSSAYFGSNIGGKSIFADGCAGPIFIQGIRGTPDSSGTTGMQLFNCSNVKIDNCVNYGAVRVVNSNVSITNSETNYIEVINAGRLTMDNVEIQAAAKITSGAGVRINQAHFYGDITESGGSYILRNIMDIVEIEGYPLIKANEFDRIIVDDCFGNNIDYAGPVIDLASTITDATALVRGNGCNVAAGSSGLTRRPVQIARISLDNSYNGIAVNNMGGNARGSSIDGTDTITGVTQTNPAVVTTSAAHGYDGNKPVLIQSITGMTELNDREFQINVLTTTTFELLGEDSTGHTAYISGGTSKALTKVSTTTSNGRENARIIKDNQFGKV